MYAPTTGWLRLGMPPRSIAPAAMLVALILAVVAPHQASAIVVPVPNFSFESPNGGVGNPNGGAATGWTANGGAPSGGVSYFSFGFPAASQGTQYHWLNLPGFAGPNPSVTRSDVGLIGAAQAGTYTLTVAGGRRDNGATTDGSYVVELLAGGTVIGSQTVNNPFATYAPGTWNDITAVAVVGPTDPALGQDLSIRLSAFDGTGGGRSQGQFDHVRLTFDPVPPDYVVTLASGALTVSDVSGNGETLAITEPVAGSIQFAAAGRVFTVNGGPNLLGSSGALSLVGLSSIAVNAGAGSDSLTVGAFTGAVPSLTLNGGTGDDAVAFNGSLTLANNSNLNVDLQDDGAPVGADAVTLAAGADVMATGAGTIIIRCSRNVALGVGASLETVNGELTVEANRQLAEPSTGSFVGVNVDNALIRASGTGAVTVRGRGGDGAGGSQFGVHVTNGGSIVGATSGIMQVDGIGGASTGPRNSGTRVTAATITSLGAQVTVTGQGGGIPSVGQGSSTGVVVTDSGQLTAGGTGAVVVSGTGGSSPGLAGYGVTAQLGGEITSGGGNVLVTGLGGVSTSSATTCSGVVVNTLSRIMAGGTGTVTVQGTGGASAGDANSGVNVPGLITSSGGDVSVTGQGGGTPSAGQLQTGVIVYLSGQITAGGSGSVTVHGTGGAAAGLQNAGVSVEQSGLISSSGGDVSVVGQGGGTPSAGVLQSGVLVFLSGQISAGGTGTVVVQGTGGPSAGQQNAGVNVAQNGSITSSGGAVSITGSGGGSTPANFNDGVLVLSGSITSGGGDASLTGTAGPGAGSFGIGVRGVSGISTATSGGDIALNANSVVFNAGSVISTQAAGAVTVRPITNGLPIVLLGPGWSGGSGSLLLLDTELDVIDAGTIHIGDANSGDIVVAGPITHPPGTLATLASPIAGTPMSSKARDGGDFGRPLLLRGAGRIAAAEDAEVAALLALPAPAAAPAPADVVVPAGEARPGHVEVAPAPARHAPSSAARAMASGFERARGVEPANDFVLTSGGDIELLTSTDRSFDTGGGTLALRPGGARAVLPVAARTDVVASALTLGPAARLAIEIVGTVADTQYTQLAASGPVDLGGAKLELSGSHVPSIGEQFTIVRNSHFTTTGEFDGLPEGGYITDFLGSPLAARITYQGGNAPPTVPNFSFESPNGGVGNPNGGAATGWTANGGAPSGGVSYFSIGFPAASEGTQYHWLNLPGFAGPNPSVTQSNAGSIGAAKAGTYTLTVAGGRRDNGATTDGSYVVELLAGGTVIGSQTVNNPFATYAPGTWNDITAVAAVGPTDPALGQDLSIRLSVYDGTGGVRSQGQFDHVRLAFAPLGANDDVVLTVVSPTTDTPVEPALPRVSELRAARPNPVTTSASLTFALAARGEVDLGVYSVDGRRVRSLARGAYEPGEHHLTWDGAAENGTRVSPGMYFVRLTTPQGTFRRSLVLLD